MPKKKADLLQGTLDLLVLKALAQGPVHGYGISLEIQKLSRDTLQIELGSLYPAIYRLEEQGLISAEWGISDNNRKARFYALTTGGRRQLAAETSRWEQASAAVNLVLGIA